MNQKTEVPRADSPAQTSEFSPDAVRILVALTVSTLILVFVFERNVFNLNLYGRYLHSFIFPWVLAGGQTIGNGLHEFSGETPAVLSLAERLEALLSLMIGFVIGPTLFFFGWQHKRKERASGSADSVLKGSGVIFTIGAILTFLIALPSVPAALMRANAEHQLRNAQAIQSNKDAIINEFDVLANSAFQFRILPHELGGGSGSFVGYVIPHGMSDTEEASYIAMVSADTIAFQARSAKYPSATARCVLNKEGNFVPTEWRYNGDFE